MIFKNSSLSLLFVLIPIAIGLILYRHQKGKKLLSLFIKKENWPTAIPQLNMSFRLYKNGLIILALLMLIVAGLRPQYGLQYEKVSRVGQEVFIILDLSESMLSKDTQPNRLQHAKREIKGLIDQLQGDKVGLIGFAGDAFIQCPLTTDIPALNLFLDELDTSYMPVPGTDIASAIKLARTSFKSNSSKAIVIFSDGESFENDPIKSTELAKKAGITVYTVGIGSTSGEPIPSYDKNNQFQGYKKDKKDQIVLSRLNEKVLKQIATEGNGAYFKTSTQSFVADSIYQLLSKHEKTLLEEKLLQKHTDRYQIFLIIALILLLLESILPDNLAKKTLWRGRL